MGGQYIIQGQPGKFRLVRAVIEGGVTINPYGLKTEEVAAITNQTLALVNVPSKPIDIKPGSSMMQIKTWKFRVVSPNSAPQREWNKRSWVEYEGKGNAESPIPAEFVL